MSIFFKIWRRTIDYLKYILNEVPERVHCEHMQNVHLMGEGYAVLTPLTPPPLKWNRFVTYNIAYIFQRVSARSGGVIFFQAGRGQVNDDLWRGDGKCMARKPCMPLHSRNKTKLHTNTRLWYELNMCHHFGYASVFFKFLCNRSYFRTARHLTRKKRF